MQTINPLTNKTRLDLVLIVTCVKIWLTCVSEFAHSLHEFTVFYIKKKQKKHCQIFKSVFQFRCHLVKRRHAY